MHRIKVDREGDFGDVVLAFQRDAIFTVAEDAFGEALEEGADF